MSKTIALLVAALVLVAGIATASGGGASGSTAPASTIDLRADTNHDGVIDLAGDSDERSAGGRAIFLANIDDDQLRCPRREAAVKTLSDYALAACNDAADAVVNGPADVLDLARLKTVPWSEAPVGASATVVVSR